MPTRKRTVEVEVVVDDKRARKNLQNIEGSTRKTAKGFSDMGKLVKLGLASFGAREMVQALQKMDRLNQAMAANEQRADTVFGSMADDAREWADDQNEAFGLGENALLGLASNMQDLLVPMGFARDEAFGLTKETLTLANALDDWKGGTLGVENATERIIKSMLGEREGLVELGIKISEADVKSRLLQKGQEDLTGAALAQAKAQATLELITEKSADAVAAYTDRAGGAVAVNKELNASLADSQETWASLTEGSLQDAKGLFGDATTVLAGLSGQLDDSTGSGFSFVDFVEKAFPPTLILTKGLESLADLFGDNSEAASDAASELTDVEKRAREATEGWTSAIERSRDEADSADRVLRGYADRIEDFGNKSFRAADEAQELAEAILNQASASRAAADPIFDAAGAVERYEDALEAANEDGKITNEELLKLAELGLDVEEALARMGAENTLGGIIAIGQELEKPTDEVATMLRDLGVLTESEWQIIVDVLAEVSDADRALINSAKRGGSGGGTTGSAPSTTGGPFHPFHQGGTVPGTPGSDQLILAQAGEEVTRRSEVKHAVPTVVEPKEITNHFHITAAQADVLSLADAMAWRLRTQGV